MPYLIDGEYSITETEAIQRYICHRWGKKALLGRDIQETARLDAILSIFNEVSGAIKELLFNKNHETAKLEVLQKYSPKLDQLQTSIGEKSFALGHLTLADFIIAEDSHYIQAFYP